MAPVQQQQAGCMVMVGGEGWRQQMVRQGVLDEPWDLGDGRMTRGRPVPAPQFTDGPPWDQLWAGRRVWCHVCGEWIEVVVVGHYEQAFPNAVRVCRVGYSAADEVRTVGRGMLALEQPCDCGKLAPPQCIQGRLSWAAKDARILDEVWRVTDEPWATVRAQDEWAAARKGN